MAEKIRVYFLGSGRIAVPVLNELNDAADIELLGIGTQLDRPAGRRKKLHPSPVGEYTQANGLDVDKAASVNCGEFLCRLRELAPDFIIVASFGQILKQPLLELPRFGCVNVHASLLPCYRGASPITAAIVNRDSKTGITFMRMDKGLDTGDIYEKVEFLLEGHERNDSLEIALGELAAGKIVNLLADIKFAGRQPKPQDEKLATMTRKLRKSDGDIDWREPAEQLEAKIRGYHPWPGTVFKMLANDREIKIHITDARLEPGLEGAPGEVLQADKKGLVIACGQGAVRILDVIPPGKKDMTAAAFLNGHKLLPGAIVS